MEKVKIKKIPVETARLLEKCIRDVLKELELPFKKHEGGFFYISAEIIRDMIYKIKPDLVGWFEKNGFDMKDNQWKFYESCCELC